ncbi:unnamed protein product [Lampetra planeri]
MCEQPRALRFPLVVDAARGGRFSWWTLLVVDAARGGRFPRGLPAHGGSRFSARPPPSPPLRGPSLHRSLSGRTETRVRPATNAAAQGVNSLAPRPPPPLHHDDETRDGSALSVMKAAADTAAVSDARIASALPATTVRELTARGATDRGLPPLEMKRERTGKGHSSLSKISQTE